MQHMLTLQVFNKHNHRPAVTQLCLLCCRHQTRAQLSQLPRFEAQAQSLNMPHAGHNVRSKKYEHEQRHEDGLFRSPSQPNMNRVNHAESRKAQHIARHTTKANIEPKTARPSPLIHVSCKPMETNIACPKPASIIPKTLHAHPETEPTNQPLTFWAVAWTGNPRCYNIHSTPNLMWRRE